MIVSFESCKEKREASRCRARIMRNVPGVYCPGDGPRVFAFTLIY